MEILQWKVTGSFRETSDAITYSLTEITGTPVHYGAGQFLTFLSSYKGHEIRRSYSIGATPGIDENIFVTVKKKVNGEISRYILETWKPGTIVTSLPPAGRFTIDTADALNRHIV